MRDGCMEVFQRDNGCDGGEEWRYKGSDVARVDGGWVGVSLGEFTATSGV